MLDLQNLVYGRYPLKVALDGGFASKGNLTIAKGRGIKDIQLAYIQSFGYKSQVGFTPLIRLFRRRQMKKKKARLDTLDGILEDAWKMLAKGAERSDDPFHWPVLGSTGQQGCNLRTVILRQVLVPDRILVCHTDARAPKAGEIQASDRVAWLFYHPMEKVQLRIYGQATLHRDDSMADEQWAAAGITSRLNYAASQPPGTPVAQPTSGLPDILRNKVPTLLESETVRPYFMAIACRIDAMDWLRLSILGNRRARFTWDDKDGVQATWLVP